MSARTCLLLALLVVVMFGWGRVAGSNTMSKRLGLPRITSVDRLPLVGSPDLFLRPQAAPDVLRDFHGNEVERAVGDYRVDVRGNLYEGHPPVTPRPRLGTPGT